MKKIIILYLLFLVNCSVPNWYKPLGYQSFKFLPKNGSPGFTLGWMHGCESGLSTQFGGGIYIFFYSWRRDPDITSSNPNIPLIRARYKTELKDVDWNDIQNIKRNFADYNDIFWHAHMFCRQNALGTVQMAGMNPKLPGEDRYGPSDHNVGSVWKINSRGDTRIGSTGPGGGYW